MRPTSLTASTMPAPALLIATTRSAAWSRACFSAGFAASASWTSLGEALPHLAELEHHARAFVAGPGELQELLDARDHVARARKRFGRRVLVAELDLDVVLEPYCGLRGIA